MRKAGEIRNKELRMTNQEGRGKALAEKTGHCHHIY
jgi:hypothetical protein